jgi:hypothetical protein
MQVTRLQVQLKQIVDVRLSPAEFERRLQLIEISQTIDLLADLGRGCRR